MIPAAFFIVAGLIVPGSAIIIKNVGLNPTRTGIIDVLLKMGADISIKEEQTISCESRGNIHVRHSKLKGVEISGGIIPRLIDEIPIIAVAASLAEGETVIKDAKELRVKESDRIKTISEELSKMGVNIRETDDGLIIEGGKKIKGAHCLSHGDHRIAMSLAIAALVAEDEVTIEDTECIETSFPGFESILKQII